MIQNIYKVIGVMSGTSLDGLDLAFCEFQLENSVWKYDLKLAETLEYTEDWKNRLKNSIRFSGLDLALLNVEYGHFLGEKIQQFIEKNQLEVDLISVHGHTVFHQPEKRFTLQIGDGAAIASYVKSPVVTQFRNVDVALGGQGAPLVPIGDKYLFNTHDFRLNLGGIANISFTKNEKIIAFDIGLCNMALNFLASRKGFAYDENGNFAAQGQVNTQLLEQLNRLDFFRQKAPKSLGFEWFEQTFLPVLQAFDCSIDDQLRTVCEHIAEQIAKVVNLREKCTSKTMFITGGGAKNRFLISRIRHHCLCKIQPGTPLLIDFKEALIFAFLGVLRMRNEVNCLSDVTGAKWDHVGGCVYFVNRCLRSKS